MTENYTRNYKQGLTPEKEFTFYTTFCTDWVFFNLVDLLLFKLKFNNLKKGKKKHSVPSVHAHISREEKLYTHIYPFINSGSS